MSGSSIKKAIHCQDFGSCFLFPSFLQAVFHRVIHCTRRLSIGFTLSSEVGDVMAPVINGYSKSFCVWNLPFDIVRVHACIMLDGNKIKHMLSTAH
eukprot:4488164-Amphidinium_carterae.2